MDRRLAAVLKPRPHRFAVLVAVVVLALAACAGPTASPSLIRTSWPVTLAGSAWTAVAVGAQPVVAASPPTATFKATTVDGTTGCNSYSGPYQYAAGVIKVGALTSTLVGCDGAIGTTEQRFMAALSVATSVSIDPDGRMILDGPGGSITFEVAGQLEAAPAAT